MRHTWSRAFDSAARLSKLPNVSGQPRPTWSRGVTLALTLAFGASFLSFAPPAEGAKSQGASKVLKTLGRIHLSLVEGRYHPVTRVNGERGRYQFDCSGMATWVLKQSAPRAFREVLDQSWTSRPVARDYVRRLWNMPRRRSSPGWKRIRRVQDLRGGDLIAWLKPKHDESAITGHVGFAVAQPQPSEEIGNGYLVRFADSSRFRHQDDTRTGEDRDGFGVGTLLLIADSKDEQPTAYGWRGEESERFNTTRIVMGRARR